MAVEDFLQWKEFRFGGAAGTFSGIAGKEVSFWQYEGTPSHGAVPPSSYANPDNTTAGGLQQTNPAANAQKWLAALDVGGSSAGGQLTLWDRLLHISGLSGTVTTPQNINGGSAATLTRHYTDEAGGVDVGNQIWLEIYSALGATGTTVTASYTNQAGTAGQTTQAVTIGGTGFNGATRMIQLPLAAGDTGVQAVTSVTLAASTLTAGNFGLIVAHPLLHIPTQANAPDSFCGLTDGMIECLTNACWFWSCTVSANPSAAAVLHTAFFSFVDK